MMHLLLEDIHVELPEWVVDRESFRRWGRDQGFPEKVPVSYLRDEVWVDLSREPLYTHSEVKAEINTVLRTMATSKGLGRHLAHGAYLSNVEADFSHKPDGVFISSEAMHDGRVKVVEGDDELEGSPDMVLEVVSRSSVERDSEVLREAYFRAGVREYWLVDARKPPLRFDILRAGRTGYVADRKHGSWTRSKVFATSFRLLQQSGADGHPAFTLEIKADAPS